jgi:hypothetical protein
MLDLKRTTVAAAIVAVALLPMVVVAADSQEVHQGAAAKNVKLTVRLGKLVDGKRADMKSYDLVLVSGGIGSKLLSGARVPLPTSGGDGSSQGFEYRNIGFTTEAHAWVLDDNRIKIVATIEDSRVVESGGGKPPTVETRQLAANAVVEPGVPMEVTRIQGIREQSGFVEIEAKVLR